MVRMLEKLAHLVGRTVPPGEPGSPADRPAHHRGLPQWQPQPAGRGQSQDARLQKRPQPERRAGGICRKHHAQDHAEQPLVSAGVSRASSCRFFDSFRQDDANPPTPGYGTPAGICTFSDRHRNLSDNPIVLPATSALHQQQQRLRFSFFSSLLTRHHNRP